MRKPEYYGNQEQYINKILEEVACGSVSKAAINLGVTPSTLRRHIAMFALEDKVGGVIKGAKEYINTEIVNLARQGLTDSTIASRLGVSFSKVRLVRRNSGLIRKRGQKGRMPKAVIKAKMMSELYGKYTYSEIAEAFGCSRQNVHQIVASMKGEE